jgi:ATP-binding cassette subfamily B protein
MKYTLSTSEQEKDTQSNFFKTLTKLWPLMSEERNILLLAFIAILVNSGLTILAPVMIGHAVDTYVLKHDIHGVLVYTGLLAVVYAFSLLASFIQTRLMGGVGQRVLFRLRNKLFMKLEELPVAFFNQNKAGDLISRINNDTDKLNQFFSQSMMQFIGNVFVIIGAGIAMLVVQPHLGGAALIPAVGLFIITRLTSNWIKNRNFKSLQAFGGLSAEIQESLDNFKVIIAFNRRDYFRQRFTEVNSANYAGAINAGIANNIYSPIFTFASSLGQLIVITYGLSLIASGNFTFGLLISYLAYVTRFYDPLRQMAQLWSNLQVALAGWDRISEILSKENDLVVVPSTAQGNNKAALEFKNVAFSYPEGKDVLHDVTFTLEPGKTYALVGPTGGGKTTTASLMARLYDPTSGEILLNGKDIRSYTSEERTKKIGFILQEPFLFGGTVHDNIIYGNDELASLSSEELTRMLKKEGLEDLLARFDEGLDTPVTSSGDSISLGQRQLIAFIRAMLRHPDILILDEATANIDTVTEQQLQIVLDKLSEKTTRVIIAHRLNTIENADVIYFVNSGTVTKAGSLKDAVKMLTDGKVSS